MLIDISSLLKEEAQPLHLLSISLFSFIYLKICFDLFIDLYAVFNTNRKTVCTGRSTHLIYFSYLNFESLYH